MIGLVMYVLRFEVTTAASGDVGHQALMFFLGLGKPFPWGAVGWCWAWKLVSLKMSQI